MISTPSLRLATFRKGSPSSAGRCRLFFLAGSLALSAALIAGCAGGSHAPDNRHPQMKHGNFEDPGSRAEDDQGNAGSN